LIPSHESTDNLNACFDSSMLYTESPAPSLMA
jgi:hypothetical protein